MEVRLIGTNIELDSLKDRLAGGEEAVLLSPEPIAAAYARISRSSKSVGELRREARRNVDKTRTSNERIVFDMGHASIAEHAVFNFDLEGVSRLAIEKLEHTRLASFTERSQRYVMIGEDFHIPAELNDSEVLKREFLALMKELYGRYEAFYGKLREFHMERDPEEMMTRQRRQDIEISAKEDARYLLPLATTGQLGMTINARSLEATVRRLKGSGLSEVRHLGQLLEEQAIAVTPSLIRYTEPGDLPLDLERLDTFPQLTEEGELDEVRLLTVCENGDQLLADAYRALSQGRAFGEASREEREVFYEEFNRFFLEASRHESAPRLFELVDLTFEVIVSAACFGQLKRHRMASILASEYQTGLGVTVPPAVKEANLEEEFVEITRRPHGLHERLREIGSGAAQYGLTNAHRRRCIMKLNLRELYHLSRLRMDGHAQWEIRRVAREMVRKAQSRFPVAAAFLCGKDEFEQLQKRFQRGSDR